VDNIFSQLDIFIISKQSIILKIDFTLKIGDKYTKTSYIFSTIDAYRSRFLIK